MSSSKSTKKDSTYSLARDGTSFFPTKYNSSDQRGTCLQARRPSASGGLPSFTTGLTPTEQSNLPKKPKWCEPPKPTPQEQLKAARERIAARKAQESAASQASSKTS